jgi:serine/threonine protein phosphatase PrpC
MSFMRWLRGRKKGDADKTGSARSLPEQGSEQFKAESQERVITMPQAKAGPVAIQSIPDASSLEKEPITLEQDDLGLSVGYVSDVGQLRGHNEDTLVAFQGMHLGHDASGLFGFFVVTDGMGGHQAGEVASSLAARFVTHEVINSVYLPFLLDATPNADIKPPTEILRSAVEKASYQVHEQVPGDGGTTLTCALILGRRAFIAHVGDSRAYLLNGHAMRQLTRDHSFVSRLIELGELSPQEATVHPQRHVLYRAVGQREQLEVDTYQQSLPPGSCLLICSDGLSGVVSDQEMGAIIAAAATPQQACQRLAEAANRAGGPDNITAVLIKTPLD